MFRRIGPKARFNEGMRIELGVVNCTRIRVEISLFRRIGPKARFNEGM